MVERQRREPKPYQLFHAPEYPCRGLSATSRDALSTAVVLLSEGWHGEPDPRRATDPNRPTFLADKEIRSLPRWGGAPELLSPPQYHVDLARHPILGLIVDKDEMLAVAGDIVVGGASTRRSAG